ncbi:MAG: hypothetical protein Pg6C_09210 [Treponemataceae bacterium]|nr:MAG: hypothetical protein Pg6C_09210 [Treponemataceae bacterium]
MNGIRLHSAYDPVREARRFIDNALDNAGFIPALIVMTEPALSYAASAIRARLPGCLACAVRYSRDFDSHNAQWDAVLYAALECPASANNMAESLYARFGEELLCAALFLPWEASERAFPEQSRLAWNSIKTAVSKARDVLATREYFAERWHKNIIRFCVSVKKITLPHKGNSPAVIAAAGPSLELAVPRLRESRGNFFLIAVSSALEPLVSRGVIPDLCVSADGGFWAKELLTGAACNDSPRHPVIACPAESAVPARLFETRAILPLSYNDNGAENVILKTLGFPALTVRRNGTVSGIALDAARAVSSGQVFFCGLDLGVSAGFQHAQPHSRELRERVFDTRVHPLALRQAVSGFNAQGSLAVYKNWFLSHTGAGVFRVAPESGYSASRLMSSGKLMNRPSNMPRASRFASAEQRESAGMRDISLDEFSRLVSHPPADMSYCGKPEPPPGDRANRARKLRELIVGDIRRVKSGDAPSVFSFDDTFPARMVHMRRNNNLIADNTELAGAFLSLMEKLLALADSLCRYCTR